MISEATIKSLARRQGVDPAVVDRDHALGVVLWAMSTQGALRDWVFKGGTCLRKCDGNTQRSPLGRMVPGRRD